MSVYTRFFAETALELSWSPRQQIQIIQDYLAANDPEPPNNGEVREVDFFNMIADSFGWDAQTQIRILLDQIVHHGDIADFNRHLSRYRNRLTG